MKTVSLITACFDSEKTIADTIRSVNTQTYPAIQHIIIDGGSKDSTVDIVKELSERDPIVVSERDKGIYDAYNKGLKLATGDVIGFINSDDFYIDEEVIKNCMRVFEDPTVEACYADLIYVNPDNTDKIERVWKSRQLSKLHFAHGLIPAHPTVFLRRDVYERFGDFDLNYRLAADYEFLLRVFFGGAIKAIYVPRIWVRMRSGGATGQNMKSVIKQNREIREAQDRHNLKCSGIIFILTKVCDRSLQHLRAFFVNAGIGNRGCVRGE